jgi:hypothetical protein
MGKLSHRISGYIETGSAFDETREEPRATTGTQHLAYPSLPLPDKGTVAATTPRALPYRADRSISVVSEVVFMTRISLRT